MKPPRKLSLFELVIYIILTVIALLVISTFQGCSTQRKLEKWCKLCPTNTTTKDSIIERERLVEIPGETKHDTLLIECPDGSPPKIADKRSSKSNIKSDYKIQGNNLIGKIQSPDTTAKVTDKESYSNTLVEKTIPCPDSKALKIFFQQLPYYLSCLILGFVIGLFLKIKRS